MHGDAAITPCNGNAGQLVVHDNDKYDEATLFSQVFSLVTNDEPFLE